MAIRRDIERQGEPSNGQLASTGDKRRTVARPPCVTNPRHFALGLPVVARRVRRHPRLLGLIEVVDR